MLDVGFNREVGADGAIYWDKEQLAQIIEEIELLDEKAISELDKKSSERIAAAFTWQKIVADYEEIFKG